MAPGRVGEVAAALGVQAGVTITVTEPDVAAERSPGVSGDFSLAVALERALRGTDAEAVFYDATTVRIVRKSRAASPVGAQATAIAAEPLNDIVVTASKQAMQVDTYPGSVKVLRLTPGWVADNAAGGTAAITNSMTVLSSTDLGSGRDKLFIRGIADSGFNGPTQATVGEYLGDLRLNYNAPDPDLNLYDMKRVEVLVGPQGTLYGAGSLGGVIRLVPNDPDTHEVSATASSGVSSTEFGGVSGDGGAMLNLPVIEGHVAVRLVASGARDAGYIDDASRGLTDINSTASYGERLALRVEDLSGWTLDFGAVLQNLSSADEQYALRGEAPLTRSSAIAQPFANVYRLYYITARTPLGDRELVSTTSAVWQNMTTVFDATGYDGTTLPERFVEDDDVFVVSHETRLSGGDWQAPWVTGITTLFSSDQLTRWLGPLGDATQIAGVVNVQAEAAVFGQISHPFTPTLTGTIGERVTFANSTGVPIENGAMELQRVSRDEAFFSNTLALDWHPGGSWSAFFHYQQGYRPGGLAVTTSGSGLESQKFNADSLNMDEVGLRWGDEGRGSVSVRAAAFFADWNSIQADLVDTRGLPYTANIGNGRIRGIDADVSWHVTAAVDVTASAFGTIRKLSQPEPQFATGSEENLPNVAGSGGRLAAEWHRKLSAGVLLSGASSVRYVGTSTLGVGQYLDIPQGNYFVADVGGRLDFGDFALSLKVDNVGDVRGNTFAFGDPFGLGERNQVTPLRPRTVRLGLDARF
jgi:iron complex outermembrane receptor protein